MVADRVAGRDTPQFSVLTSGPQPHPRGCGGIGQRAKTRLLRGGFSHTGISKPAAPPGNPNYSHRVHFLRQQSPIPPGSNGEHILRGQLGASEFGEALGPWVP